MLVNMFKSLGFLVILVRFLFKFKCKRKEKRDGSNSDFLEPKWSILAFVPQKVLPVMEIYYNDDAYQAEVLMSWFHKIPTNLNVGDETIHKKNSSMVHSFTGQTLKVLICN